jgi:hypothetical protein
MYSCPTCIYQSEKLISLSVHWRKVHSRTARELYILLFCEGGVEPTCGCGCGSHLKFISVNEGFTEFCRGHISRIKNNWGHNLVARARSGKTRSRLHKEGKLICWNKGKTKDTDERVRKGGISQSHNMTDEKRRIRSERMRKNRLDGTIPTNRGPSHPGWQGGTSSISAIAHSRLTSWVYPKLNAAGFKCVQCGSKDRLQVHHDKIKFAEIVHLIVPILDREYSFEEKCKFADEVVQYHLDNEVSGIVLCFECHQKLHPSLNFR